MIGLGEYLSTSINEDVFNIDANFEDVVYQKVVQVLAGHKGWVKNVTLTTDGILKCTGNLFPDIFRPGFIREVEQSKLIRSNELCFTAPNGDNWGGIHIDTVRAAHCNCSLSVARGLDVGIFEIGGANRNYMSISYDMVQSGVDIDFTSGKSTTLDVQDKTVLIDAALSVQGLNFSKLKISGSGACLLLRYFNKKSMFENDKYVTKIDWLKSVPAAFDKVIIVCHYRRDNWQYDDRDRFLIYSRKPIKEGPGCELYPDVDGWHCAVSDKHNPAVYKFLV